ncbi:hypothetical protein MKW92_009983, partial [Papaver armeniacum]
MFLEAAGRNIRAKLVHDLAIVESLKGRVKSRERLMDCDLGICAYADALSAVSVIDELGPEEVLGLFLESRKSWVSMKLGGLGAVISIFCDIVKIIHSLLNDVPLFYKTILGSLPGSQLFGGLPRRSLNLLCWYWINTCGEETVNKVNGRHLIDSTGDRKVLEGSLEWLKSIFVYEIESLWNRIHELLLGNDEDLWMVSLRMFFCSCEESISAIVAVPGVTRIDCITYLNRPSTGGTRGATNENDTNSCLNAYFGPEVGQIRDAVNYIKEDSQPPAILIERSLSIGHLSFVFRNLWSRIPLIVGSSTLRGNATSSMMFDKGTSQSLNGVRRQSLSTWGAFSGVIDSASPKLSLLSTKFQDICIWADSLWLTWVSDEMSAILSKDNNYDALSLASSLRVSAEYIWQLFFYLRCSQPQGDLRFERGVLQIQLGLRFTFDILSGGELNMNDELSKTPKSKLSMKSLVQKQDSSVTRKHVLELTSSVSQRVDPVGWQMCLYFWENEKQAYLGHAVLFDFFVQLDRTFAVTASRTDISHSSVVRSVCHAWSCFFASQYLSHQLFSGNHNLKLEAQLTIISVNSSWKLRKSPDQS